VEIPESLKKREVRVLVLSEEVDRDDQGKSIAQGLGKETKKKMQKMH
jgi:hypothetical protein